MIGLFLKQENDTAERSALLRAVNRVDDGDVVILSPTGKAMSWPVQRNEALSMLFALPEGGFDTVAISPTLRLFAGDWSRVLLSRIARSLKPDGSLWAPIAPQAKARGHWSKRWLRGALATRGRVHRVDDQLLLHFIRPIMAEPPPSVLGWYFAEQTRLLESSSEPDRLIRRMNYGLFGANYKCALISFIIDRCLRGRSPLSLLDVGGSAGLTSMEILLAHRRVDRVTVIEPDLRHRPVAESLTSFFAERQGGRFGHVWRDAQSHEFEEPVDVVIFIASLLYVPRDELQDLLQQIWQSLNPGGLLIVHENIKNPSYERDHDVMFTVEEIDERLGQFGSIRRFSSTATCEVSKEAAKESTVFRVVQKP